MKIKKAYKFRLKPSPAQEALLNNFSGQTRYVWNKALALNLARLRNGQRIMYYQELDFWSKLWKHTEEYGFLRECPAHLLQQKLRDLERAFKDAFDKKQPNKRLPGFKKRGQSDSFRFPAPAQVKLEHHHITFPKLGRMRFYRSRDIVGDIKNYTVRRRGRCWSVSIQVETELVFNGVQRPNNAIGLDMGIKHFVTTSDGDHIAPLNSFRKLSHTLAIAQRRQSRKKKYSQNWRKSGSWVTRIHQKITDTRRDFQHKLSTMISKNHAIIVVEALKIKNMSRSASGTRENPGKCVRAKSGLNKAILDQGWYEFKRQLEYKSYWRGGLVIEVPPQHTSQRCSNCQHIDARNRQTQEKFACIKCYKELNADINAAKNILAAGHAVLACGASA
jgi:putative transposase